MRWHEDILCERTVEIHAEHFGVQANQGIIILTTRTVLTGDDGHDANGLAGLPLCGEGAGLVDGARDFVPEDARGLNGDESLGDVDVCTTYANVAYAYTHQILCWCGCWGGDELGLVCCFGQCKHGKLERFGLIV